MRVKRRHGRGRKAVAPVPNIGGNGAVGVQARARVNVNGERNNAACGRIHRERRDRHLIARGRDGKRKRIISKVVVACRILTADIIHIRHAGNERIGERGKMGRVNHGK